MPTKDDGGAAFPTAETDENYAGSGMTLRDYFAGQILAGAVGYPEAANSMVQDKSNHARLADVAYSIADAMLEARKE